MEDVKQEAKMAAIIVAVVFLIVMGIASTFTTVLISLYDFYGMVIIYVVIALVWGRYAYSWYIEKYSKTKANAKYKYLLVLDTKETVLLDSDVPFTPTHFAESFRAKIKEIREGDAIGG